jgi:LmbE family N-acetylglucosaminyl deacetylase
MTKALAVVAHHDDHILWMGGTIERMNSWDWTLVAMCVNRSERQTYYDKCCKALGVAGLRFGHFGDSGGLKAFVENDQNNMRSDLIQALQGQRFDFVFTHNPDEDGEYGLHPNHMEVATIVTDLVARGELCSDSGLAYFAYKAMYGGNGLPTVARMVASYYLQLTYGELSRKCGICLDVPDLDPNLIQLGYPCPTPEAFNNPALELPPPFVRGDRAKLVEPFRR